MKNRIFSIDILKVIAIFGVVFIHGATCLGCVSDFVEFIKHIFRFAVPCFIIVWSYFVEKSLFKKDKKQQFQYIKERFVHLFVVFFLWSLLYFCFFIDFNFQNLNFLKMLSTNFSGDGWPGQYFFIVLFQLIILFPLFRILHTNKKISIIIYIVSIALYIVCGYCTLPNIINNLSYRPFVFWIPYVFVGIAFAHGFSMKISAWWLLTVLLIPVECHFRQTLSSMGEFHNYILPSVLVSSVTVSVFTMQYNTAQYNAIISYIGKNTMMVFVANPLVIKIIQHIPFGTLSDCGIVGKFILPFVSVSIILVACLVIGKLLSLIKLDKIIY